MNSYDAYNNIVVLTTTGTTTGTAGWVSTDAANYASSLSFTPSVNYIIQYPSPEDIKNLLALILKCISHNISFDMVEKEINKVTFNGFEGVLSGLEKLLKTKEKKKILFDELEDDIIKEIVVPTLQRKVSMVNL